MIDVIVVNWNAGGQLRDCVESVLKHGEGEVSKIIVVDNGSTDGSELSIEGLPSVVLVRAGSNLGFGKACNLGFAKSTAPFILLLNPDARLQPSALQAASKALRSDRAVDIGIVGLRNVAESGEVQRTCARFPSPWTFFASSLGLSTLFPNRFLDLFMREWPHDEDREVDHVIGSCALVRRHLWHRLGGMDERFFMYLEDLDFSRRARAAGSRTWFLASAEVYHKGGGTSEQVKATRLFYSLRSRLFYAAKHFRTFGASVVAFGTLVIEPLTRIGGATLARQWRTAAETVRGYAALYRALPAITRGIMRQLRRDRAGEVASIATEVRAPSRVSPRSLRSEATGWMRRTTHRP
jgi:GT2 family glycosyltransferase